MAVIDEKGRLFGKVNLLDLVVVIAVVAVAARFGYQKVAAKAVTTNNQDTTVEVTALLSPVRQFTIDALPQGTDVYDSKSNAYLGKIVATKKTPAIVTNVGPDGNLWQSESKTSFDYYVTVRGPGHSSPNAVTMGGIEVKIGRDIDFKTKLWANPVVTVDVNEHPPAR
ncbi:MAG: hypothetical protein JWN15_779 [Firmicutes bacterium]|nr:hypothetical protein [Bacillota bacterium]